MDSIDFKNWRKKAVNFYMIYWNDSPINVVYDPWIHSEYEAFKKGITPEEYVTVEYLEKYFMNYVRDKKISQILE